MLETIENTTKKFKNQSINTNIIEDFHIPVWHKEIVLSRMESNPTFVDGFEMIKELKKEYSEKV